MSNTSAAELLKQMKLDSEANTAAATNKTATFVDSEQFCVKLRILKLRRQQVIFAVAVSFITFAILIARDYRKDRAWWLTGFPIAAVGLMIALIPPSEEWEYKPWQARARQYERNQIIR